MLRGSTEQVDPPSPLVLLSPTSMMGGKLGFVFTERSRVVCKPRADHFPLLDLNAIKILLFKRIAVAYVVMYFFSPQYLKIILILKV